MHAPYGARGLRVRAEPFLLIAFVHDVLVELETGETGKARVARPASFHSIDTPVVAAGLSDFGRGGRRLDFGSTERLFYHDPSIGGKMRKFLQAMVALFHAPRNAVERVIDVSDGVSRPYRAMAPDGGRCWECGTPLAPSQTRCEACYSADQW